MPSVEIKAAIQTLLLNAFGPDLPGDGRLKHVLTQYPLEDALMDPTDLPRAILYMPDHQPEVLKAGGRSGTVPNPGDPGTTVVPWDLVIALYAQYTDPVTQADAFDQLGDDIENLIRSYRYNLNVASTGTRCRVERIMLGPRRTLPPIRSQNPNSYNAYINLRIEEWQS